MKNMRLISLCISLEKCLSADLASLMWKSSSPFCCKIFKYLELVNCFRPSSVPVRVYSHKTLYLQPKHFFVHFKLLSTVSEWQIYRIKISACRPFLSHFFQFARSNLLSQNYFWTFLKISAFIYNARSLLSYNAPICSRKVWYFQNFQFTVAENMHVSNQ